MTALCRAICVFIIPQNAIKCNFQIQSCENPPRFYAPHKNTPPSEGNYTGGNEGIRTLDTVARILHFQCSALDQLCDVSEFLGSDYSADNSAVSSAAAASTPPSSTNVFSNSASISRSNGSSAVPTSNESSPSAIDGASLYD